MVGIREGGIRPRLELLLDCLHLGIICVPAEKSQGERSIYARVRILTGKHLVVDYQRTHSVSGQQREMREPSPGVPVVTAGGVFPGHLLESRSCFLAGSVPALLLRRRIR